MFHQRGNVLGMEIRAAFIMLRVWMTLNNKKPLAGTSLRVAAFSALARGGRLLVTEEGRAGEVMTRKFRGVSCLAPLPRPLAVSESVSPSLGSAQARASVAG